MLRKNDYGKKNQLLDSDPLGAMTTVAFRHCRHNQGLFLDCDTNDAANCLVVELVRELLSALEAFGSIALLVNFDVPVCARALAARLR